MVLRSAILIGCPMLLLAAGSAQGDAPSQQDFYCTQGSAARIVSIITVPASERLPHGACHVDYTKDKTTKTLWSSSTGHGYCIKKATAFVTQLADAHYSCSLKTKELPDK
jgi:hypothetical protein